MTAPTVAPYGSWKSPITADLIVAGTIRLGDVAGDGNDIYWLEGRPAEKGRTVLVRRTLTGEQQDVTPPEFNVRTRVLEYGGGAYLIDLGTVYFSNFADQRLYRQTIRGQINPSTVTPEPITPAGEFRYADAIMDSQRQRLICVREDHSQPGEAVNSIVAVDLKTGTVEVLVQGADFYATPRVSPEGGRLSWISWNHPNMPWDGTELFVAPIESDCSVGEIHKVAGGEEESIFQPQWSPNGVLYFVSDRSNWWNFYRYLQADTQDITQGKVEPIYEMPAEFGLPHWVFGMSTYGFASAERMTCTYTEAGNWYLASLDLTAREMQNNSTPYTAISSVQVSGDQVLFLGASPTESSTVVKLNVGTGDLDILQRSSSLEVPKDYLSSPQSIEFPTTAGKTAYGFFYLPTNQDYTAPEAEKPPLIVKSHGGPTAATSSALSLKIQYWTSRGFAVLDVNYGGSTGYGREYRQRLRDQWGIVDVDDCTNAAKYLAEKGWVDGDHMAITGGSAGGYTTLCALTFQDVFKAGASYYGVSDLEALARDTHKFESRYLDRLVGPYPASKAVYKARSPIYATEQLSCPVIFFQGLEDKVVPPNQAEQMVNVLKSKGLTVEYVAFEGEQHGFRQAENIKRTLEEEYQFYAKVFGFEPVS
ncbi:MAG: S9 family peptidase [Microcoleaceae cyanobacterium]